MLLDTARLKITDMTPDMAGAIYHNSQDEDNRRFVPDEVYESLQEAQEAVDALIKAAGTEQGPFVYPVTLKENDAVIGYVQACGVEEGFEIGYHIAKPYTGQGYATEALSAFAPMMMERLGVRELWGIVLEDNRASHRVLEKCGFTLAFRGEDGYQGERRLLRRYVLRA